MGPYGYEIKSDQYEKAFSGLAFPSVRRVSLPPQATILGCFPEVVEVLANRPFIFDGSVFLDNVISHCPKIECFGWRELPPMPWGRSIERNSRSVVEKMPNIRRIEYYTVNCYVDEIKPLLALNLEKITLVIESPDDDSAEVGQMVEAAQRVLAGSSLPKRCLEVILEDESQIIVIPDEASKVAIP
jgi:hypothetical protein